MRKLRQFVLRRLVLLGALLGNVLTASCGNLDGKLILATEQAAGAIEIFQAQMEPTTNVIWRWTAKDDPNIREQDKRLFVNPDECKSVDGGRLILVTASGGGFAGIDVAARRCVFYGKAGGNPHSVERLPDGRIAVASSTGATLKIFDVSKYPLDPERQPCTQALDLPGGHGVVWDTARQSLFALGYTNIFECAYVPETMSVRVKRQWDFTAACGDPLGHDFLSDGKGGFLFTNESGGWAFDPESGAFRLACGIPNIKSFSPSSNGDLLSVPREKWWTDTLQVVTMSDGAVLGVREIKRPKARFYKARWFEKYRRP